MGQLEVLADREARINVLHVVRHGQFDDSNDGMETMTPTQQLQIKKLSEQVRREQRDRTLASLRAIGLIYLPHYLEKPPQPHA